MARGKFLGFESLGPEDDHAPDHVPADSPRLHVNRKSSAERGADLVLARQRARVVRTPDGHEITLEPHVPMKDCHTLVRELGDAPGPWPVHLSPEIEAHELRGGERRTGRWVRDGAEVFPETINDREYLGGGNSAEQLSKLKDRKP